ncbi:MAG: L-serine ammonia-lyase [Aquabacterium sp.]|jgi:L-serine dehydratase|uniref:L-serine ammonia-lyase n=1 Tax=Aquabacterium sp. TaxID=1872578 RepID=UPI003BAF621B
MAVSVFDLFKVGIGPSSSHTVGPMRAARLFALRLQQHGLIDATRRVRCEFFGSLGATGRGHGSDKAVLLGLCGHEPDQVDVDRIDAILADIRQQHRLPLLDTHGVAFDVEADLIFHLHHSLPFHPNALRLSAFDEHGQALAQRCYYSVGGGFVVSEELAHDSARQHDVAPDTEVLPLPFHSAADLLALCEAHELDIAGVMRANERLWRSDAEIDTGLLHIWTVMQACVQRGCEHEGVLPGPFKVPRRAPTLSRKLQANTSLDPLAVMDWVNLFALAVNEENAAGGRVVTAPTNGAAGIMPAVLHYYRRFVPTATDRGVIDFLLTAGAIGLLYKENASISGAEVGCQGEVGVACSMAAAGLCAVLGGTPAQVENAAEIGMEHHLGLTCDPVGGLVQIPCIERNAVAAVKAINAARLALHGDGTHHVSLDQVIKTMRETGADMQSKYKETSRGGLAVNIVAC